MDPLDPAGLWPEQAPFDAASRIDELTAKLNAAQSEIERLTAEKADLSSKLRIKLRRPETGKTASRNRTGL